jgi:hypothetical protein
VTNVSGYAIPENRPKASAFESFLDRHAQALRIVKNRASLSAWHREFVPAWTSRAREFAAEANTTYGLGPPQTLRPEVGYLAVESASRGASRSRPTYVLVSVNPGWDTQTSKREQALKGCPLRGPYDVEQYERFRRAYFPEWRERVGAPTSPRKGLWWSNALAFLHAVAGVEPMRAPWQGHPDVDVIGWELWPFHSASDGLSHASASSWPLQRFAGESLRAALRVPSAGVVVASPVGFELLRGQLHAECELGFETRVDNVFCMGLTHRPTGRRVVAARRQLFSRWGKPSSETRANIAARFRAYLNGGE